MLRWFLLGDASRLRRRILHSTLAAIVAGTATVSAPAHADAQFWEDFLRSSNRRVQSAPRPPERVYRAKRAPNNAAMPRQGTPIANGAAVGVASVTASTPSLASSGGQKSDPSNHSVPVLAVVSLSQQQISLYGATGLIERSKISSGTADNPTPTGVFGVTQKNRWHESNLYSGAEMPFMQRLTWGGIALHEGKLPGYPASHGCIRLPATFAQRLFGLTRSGFRVVIAPDDIVPVSMTHRVLPKARYWPTAVAEATRPIRTAGLGAPPIVQERQSEARLDPIAYATAERAAAKSDLKPAEEAASRAKSVSDAAAKRAKMASTELRVAEKRLDEARAWLTDLGLAGSVTVSMLPTELARTPLDRDIVAAIAEHAEALIQVDAARLTEATARADAAIARNTYDAADARVEWLKKRITDMGRRQEIASILISRKDRRLYVRQAMRPVFDMPVTIRESDIAIGNHIFVATTPRPGQSEFEWLALSLPVEDRPVRATSKSGERRPIQAVRAETAVGALDRIEIPGEVVERLSELVWTGSTIIITDNGPGHDGVPGHDFAVETKH